MTYFKDECVHVRLCPKCYRQLTAAARRHRLPRSKLLRLAIERYLARRKKDVDPPPLPAVKSPPP